MRLLIEHPQWYPRVYNNIFLRLDPVWKCLQG